MALSQKSTKRFYAMNLGPPPGSVFADLSGWFVRLSVYVALNGLVMNIPTTTKTIDRHLLSTFFIFLDCSLLLHLDNDIIFYKFLEVFGKKSLQKF